VAGHATDVVEDFPTFEGVVHGGFGDDTNLAASSKHSGSSDPLLVWANCADGLGSASTEFVGSGSCNATDRGGARFETAPAEDDAGDMGHPKAGKLAPREISGT